jgi:uncharacterized membrane protein
MKTIHRLLLMYTIMVLFLVALFSYVVYTNEATKTDMFSMVLSIAMFCLIPFGIILILWKRHRC